MARELAEGEMGLRYPGRRYGLFSSGKPYSDLDVSVPSAARTKDLNYK